MRIFFDEQDKISIATTLSERPKFFQVEESASLNCQRYGVDSPSPRRDEAAVCEG